MPNPTLPTKEELKKKLSPYHLELYQDDEFTIPIAKAWVAIDLILLEWQRSRVSEQNRDTIADLLLALNGDYKLLKLFADKGQSRITEINNQKNTHAK